MLKGDLTATPLAPLLLQLADEDATGCLHISDLEGDEALIYFRSGLVYAVSVPGRRPQLGAKLVSSGELAPEALADALDAQRTELQGWRLGELLVHLGYVDQPVVEAFVKEQVHDALWDLIKWDEGRWRFRKNEKTREDVAPPMPVTDLLANLRDRGAEWETISTVVHGPTAVPMLSARGGGSAETTLDADAWSMLCKIDGERSAAELARDCGYTLFEAGQILVTLVKAGLVDIEEDVEVVPSSAPADADDDLYGAQTVGSALAAVADESAEVVEDGVADDGSDSDGGTDTAPADPPGDEFAALARLVTEVAASTREDSESPTADEVYPVAEPAPAARTEDDDVAAAVAAIASLSAARIEDELPTTSTELHPLVDEEAFAASIARVSSALADVLGPSPEADDPFEVPAELRIKKQSKRDKKPARTPETERRERLRNAAAAELAAAHALAEAIRAGQAEEKAVAEVVDLGEVRREAEEAAARRAAEEAERVAAEEAERAAAEEAARLAAEEAERVAAAEAERVAAEDAARLTAEREAAEVEGWAEYWQREADEAARREAEEAAALLAVELAEAEEAGWAEYAERQAAEEEAARIAAEEEAARVEAERIAAEEEAARVAAEEEAARLEAERIAAEEEAARIAAEEEAARLEAERIAAEEEAARVAAEEEAARLVAERDEAEEEAWEEYWRREADLAAEAAEAAEAAAVAAAALAEAAAEDDVVADSSSEDETDDQPEPIALEFEVPQLAPDDEIENEAARRESARAEMASATALLVELSAQSVDVPAQPTADEAPDATEEVVDDDELDDEQVAVGVGAAAAMSQMTDTAALLRELSSLGGDDEPAPAPPPRTPSRPTPPSSAPAKKKRGLFGR